MVYKKREGFSGQINIVVPQNVIREIRKDPLLDDLYVTDIGYYPSAKYHYRKRIKGAKEHILIYVLEGKGWVEVENTRHILTENCFFIIPSSVDHSYAADHDAPWTIYWVHFKGRKTGLFERTFNRTIRIDDSHVSRTEERVELFNEIIGNLSTGYNQENIAYVNLCMGHLLASFCYMDQFNTIKTPADGDLVHNIIFYMQNNLHANFKLKELADHFGLSPSHFSKIFKRRTRYSPIDYFIHLKVQHACQLLDFSNMRVSEISRELGYQDQFYFSRVFKKAMNISPRAYREKN